MRYTLIIIPVSGPADQDLPVPPEGVVDMPSSAAYQGAAYQVWWERPEEVPLPVSWPEQSVYSAPGSAARKARLHYRVARAEERKSLLDSLPPDAQVRLRLGGKGCRMFRECRVSEAMDVFRAMVQDMVTEWGGGPDDPSRAHHWDPGWEFLKQDLMWIKLPSGLTIRWTPWGDSDESGGHDLEPKLDNNLSVDEVELQPHMVDTSNALAHHTKMARLIQEFLDLFKDATT